MTPKQRNKITQLATELQLAIELTDDMWLNNTDERADNALSHMVMNLETFKIHIDEQFKKGGA